MTEMHESGHSAGGGGGGPGPPLDPCPPCPPAAATAVPLTDLQGSHSQKSPGLAPVSVKSPQACVTDEHAKTYWEEQHPWDRLWRSQGHEPRSPPPRLGPHSCPGGLPLPDCSSS